MNAPPVEVLQLLLLFCWPSSLYPNDHLHVHVYPLIAGICLHEVWFLSIHSSDHYKAYYNVYLYSCIGSGGALDYVMKVSGFLSFSLCELSSWQEAGNTTILVLFMLRQSKVYITYYNIEHHRLRVQLFFLYTMYVEFASTSGASTFHISHKCTGHKRFVQQSLYYLCELHCQMHPIANIFCLPMPTPSPSLHLGYLIVTHTKSTHPFL